MQGTLINSTFRARDVGCVVAKAKAQLGVASIGGGGGMPRIAIVQSCLCNLTQQPLSVLWKLDATVDNTPRQKAM